MKMKWTRIYPEVKRCANEICNKELVKIGSCMNFGGMPDPAEDTSYEAPNGKLYCEDCILIQVEEEQVDELEKTVKYYNDIYSCI